MRSARHPDTGKAGALVRQSLFTLLVITVVIGALINGLVSLLANAQPTSTEWWMWTILTTACIVILIVVGIYWDDHRIGRTDIPVEWLACYKIANKNRRVTSFGRRSYKVSSDAIKAWESRWKKNQPGLEYPVGMGLSKLLPEHFDLLRYLLMTFLADYGDNTSPSNRIHSYLRIPLEHEKISNSRWPELLSKNPFQLSVGRAAHQSLLLPKNCSLDAFSTGDIILQVDWTPPVLGRINRLKLLRDVLPGGRVNVRWLGPVDQIRRDDKRFEIFSIRLDNGEKQEILVLTTRLIIEVETRWNFINQVAAFSDWGINFAQSLARYMDIHEWWEYHLETAIFNLENQIGYIDWKNGEHSITTRLTQIEDRLERIEGISPESDLPVK